MSYSLIIGLSQGDVFSDEESKINAVSFAARFLDLVKATPYMVEGTEVTSDA